MNEFNLEAERGVIGALLLNADLCDDVQLIVKPDDFYNDSNRRIYRHLLAMNADAKGIDLTLLVNDLRESGELEVVGGEAYIGELMVSVQVTAHATYYAKLVAQCAMRRRVVAACEAALDDAKSDSDIKSVVARAEERIFAVSEENAGQAPTVSDLFPDVFHILDARSNGEFDGVPTGFYALDDLIGGLRDSELIVLAARPSMGKTALAANIAEHVALEEKKPVLFFSLEMSKTEVVIRLLNARAQITNSAYKCKLTTAETERFNRAVDDFKNAKFRICEGEGFTVAEIAAVARRVKRKEGLGLIVIDYLSLIEPDNDEAPRHEQVAKISRRLKGMARALNVPVLCLAQLNRATEQGKDNRPRLSNLRESGAIEQDADVVIFIHREEYYHTQEEVEEKGIKGLADIIVAKHRNGPVGDVKLGWMSRYTMFTNLQSNEPETEVETLSEFADFD